MRDGGMLINTGRSWTIDSDALIAELKTGRISAAIDVFDEEPLPIESEYRNSKTSSSTRTWRQRRSNAASGKAR